ncbi:molybdopterin dehydrogenase [Alkalibaculum sp. M08DMB]|uniref:Molybdopterin dehydrogenase n=1 Tax=Alkalibaculum sporogenes TaxID=2655001 RepID=A0A6A7K9G7_9FIRM|nr:molybdopterin dehydrogenase [Alkalibaculum sporogenes]
MFTLKDYIVPESIEEASQLLNQNRNNVILGGLLWLKMGNKNYNKGIDLSKLGLNTIIENESSIEIGCMVTLRQIEISKVLNTYFNSLLVKSVKNIVGVQFRNCATVGGSVYSRFGFSDLLTALLALDTHVHLFHGGVIPLEEFINMTYKKDILIKIIINKDTRKASYQSHRKSATDLPVLAVAISRYNSHWKISIGARPNKAMIALKSSELLSHRPDQIESACNQAVSEMKFGTNIRGSAEYRRELAKVLIRRGVEEICR